MTVTLMPDVEYVLWDYLRQQADVAGLVGGLSDPRIYKAAIPRDPVGPLIKLTRIAGAPLISYPAVLDSSRVQFDCYGGSQREANRLAETVRSVLWQGLVNFQHSDGLMIGAVPDPPSYQPDPSWNTDRGGAKPRYIFDVIVVSRLPR